MGRVAKRLERDLNRRSRSLVSQKPGDPAPLLIVFVVVGVGLLMVGLLEFSGLIGYRPNRQPIGVPAWLIAGASCLVIAAAISRWRK